MLKQCKTCKKVCDLLSWEDECYTCRKQRGLNQIKNQIVSGEIIETDGEDEIVCPWCGEVIEADFELEEAYIEGDHAIDCPECGKEFWLETNIRYSYGTHRDPPSYIMRDRERREKVKNSEFAEFCKTVARSIYEEYIINQEKSRHGAGTPLAAQVKVQAKYSATERKCQDKIDV